MKGMCIAAAVNFKKFDHEANETREAFRAFRVFGG